MILTRGGGGLGGSVEGVVPVAKIGHGCTLTDRVVLSFGPLIVGRIRLFACLVQAPHVRPGGGRNGAEVSAAV